MRCGVRKRFGKLALSASEDPDVFFLDQAKGWGALGPFYIWKLSNRICDAAKHAKHAASLELLNVVELESLIPEMTENFLLTLILEICNRGGIRITEECLRQLNADNGSASYGFEFVTADIVDIVPVVKHMHQVYWCIFTGFFYFQVFD